MAFPTNTTNADEHAISAKAHVDNLAEPYREASQSSGQMSSFGLTEDELALEKKLRWKIDLMIMPLIVWTYLMNYIDRSVTPTVWDVG